MIKWFISLFKKPVDDTVRDFTPSEHAVSALRLLEDFKHDYVQK